MGLWSKQKSGWLTGSTISTLLHDRINPKDCQVLFLGDTGFLQFFRAVSRDYGKPRLRFGGWKYIKICRWVGLVNGILLGERLGRLGVFEITHFDRNLTWMSRVPEVDGSMVIGSVG